jgi:glycosyltransferase involved in cell wall biosynthesis
LARKGFAVEVLTTDPKGVLPQEEDINNVHVRRFKSWSPGGAYYFSRGLRKWLIEHSDDFDIVHAHGYHSLPALYAAQAKSKNSFVFTPHYHGRGATLFRTFLHVLYKHLGQTMFDKADRIVCVSTYERDLLVRNFSLDMSKLVIIGNGITLPDSNMLTEKRDSNTILYVGRLEKYKGVQFVINALPRLNETIHVEIVGKGPYKEKLVGLCKRLGVMRRVDFCEDLPRDELFRRYARAGLFITLSDSEAFGITVAEALSAGTPCIVAKSSGLNDWIDQRNCFCVDLPINMDKLVHLINRVMGTPIEKMKLLTWDEVVEKLSELYFSL